MHFSAYYNDDCYIHRSAKESCSGRGWSPRKPSHYNPEPVFKPEPEPGTRQQILSAMSCYADGLTKKAAFQVKILVPSGKIPTRGTKYAAGYDIYSAQSTIIATRARTLVNTEIAIAMPPGTPPTGLRLD